MSFFDSKLEVLDFELTPYGKYLLSLGRLTPSYYAFYDNDIIYDSGYAKATSTESQNLIEPRIQEETPKTKIQHIFHGAETEINNSYDLINIKNKLLFSDHIGTSKYEGNNVPTWDVKLLNNTISSSTAYDTTSFNKIINLPQININLNYDIYYVNPANVTIPTILLPSVIEQQNSELSMDFHDENFLVDSLRSSTNNDSQVHGPYEDGNYVFVDGNNFVIDMIENNNFDEKDSFELEIYEVTEDSDGNDQLRQLYFFQNYLEKVKNDILLDASEVLANIPNITLTSDYVEYYFNLLNDNNIPNDIVCKHIDNGAYSPKQKTKYKNIVKCNQVTVAVSPVLPIDPQKLEKCDV
jgi:hypothetical protein